ncbi:hypothetical protein HY502_01595 [Candidatus Woesebacteria bacterium]|nr:hypothetical protein [Candidatus Woesebacteria bacterium]
MQRLAANGITNPALGPALGNKSGEEFLAGFLPAAIGLAFLIGILIFFLAMIAGALKWTYSGGDKTMLEDARKQILHAIMGVLVLLSVLAIVKVLESFFGINILSIDIGSFQVK